MSKEVDFVAKGIKAFEEDEELFRQEYFSEDGVLTSWEDLYRQEMEYLHRKNNFFFLMAGATADIGMHIIDTR